MGISVPFEEISSQTCMLWMHRRRFKDSKIKFCPYAYEGRCGSYGWNIGPYEQNYPHTQNIEFVLTLYIWANVAWVQIQCDSYRIQNSYMHVLCNIIHRAIRASLAERLPQVPHFWIRIALFHHIFAHIVRLFSLVDAQLAASPPPTSSSSVSLEQM